MHLPANQALLRGRLSRRTLKRFRAPQGPHRSTAVSLESSQRQYWSAKRLGFGPTRAAYHDASWLGLGNHLTRELARAAGIEWHDDGAEAQRADKCNDPERIVGGPQDHSIALPYAGLGEPRGRPAALLPERVIGPGLGTIAALCHQCR